MKTAVCDFCSDPHPTKRLACNSFEVQDTGPIPERVGSDGDFLACETCAYLVHVNDRQALLNRALTAFDQRHPEYAGAPDVMQRELKRLVRAFHQQFFDSRIRVKDGKP